MTRQHSEPTWENQIWHARKLAKEKGLRAVYNPHGMIGKQCRCGNCFCCAALYVWNHPQTEIGGPL